MRSRNRIAGQSPPCMPDGVLRPWPAGTAPPGAETGANHHERWSRGAVLAGMQPMSGGVLPWLGVLGRRASEDEFQPVVAGRHARRPMSRQGPPQILVSFSCPGWVRTSSYNALTWAFTPRTSWRWRESNPRPSVSQQDFSERSRWRSQASRRHRRRRGAPVNLSVPGGPSTKPLGKPYLMTPAFRPAGLGPDRRSLWFRQRLRSQVTWRLCLCSGSLTWLRRPRLASPASTSEVEALHPLVTTMLPPEGQLYSPRRPRAIDRAISRSASRVAMAWRLS